VTRRIAQRGFTLIELVVVITILGILAAFAVPRFASLEGQARLAATQSLAGSIRSGASLAHALWLAQADPASTSVTMEGQTITMTNGYPNDTSIDDTLVEYTGFSLATAAGSAVFTKRSASGATIANCFVTYTPPVVTDAAPQVVSTTGGC
jgi:MSHA pilin protein MshA